MQDKEPTPQEPTPAKPFIDRRQVEFMETLAGVRASAEAARLGGDPETMRNLVTASVDAITIAGVTLEPPSGGHLYLLSEMSNFFESNKFPEPPLAVTWCLAEGPQVLGILNAPLPPEDILKTIRMALFRFGAQFKRADIKALNQWVAAELAILNSDAPKKTEGE